MGPTQRSVSNRRYIMNKIICDICGTAYPETADKCHCYTSHCFAAWEYLPVGKAVGNSKPTGQDTMTGPKYTLKELVGFLPMYHMDEPPTTSRSRISTRQASTDTALQLTKV